MRKHQAYCKAHPALLLSLCPSYMAASSQAHSPPLYGADSFRLVSPRFAIAPFAEPSSLCLPRRQMEDKPSSQKRRKVEVEVEEEEDVLADLDDDELDPNQAEPEMMKCILPGSVLLPPGASHIPHLQRAVGST